LSLDITRETVDFVKTMGTPPRPEEMARRAGDEAANPGV
jgi:hypothetical protein